MRVSGRNVRDFDRNIHFGRSVLCACPAKGSLVVAPPCPDLSITGEGNRMHAATDNLDHCLRIGKFGIEAGGLAWLLNALVLAVLGAGVAVAVAHFEGEFWKR